MGTNYYWKVNPENGEEWNESIEEDNPLRHIGKRSMSGPYCFKCGVTLYKGGTAGLHVTNPKEYGFYCKCPICGEEGEASTSFTITMKKHVQMLDKYENHIKCVVNEYMEEFTACEMLNIIFECPIQFQNASFFA